MTKHSHFIMINSEDLEAKIRSAMDSWLTLLVKVMVIFWGKMLQCELKAYTIICQ
jgi:hypothetical protein